MLTDSLHILDTDIANKKDLWWHSFLKSFGLSFINLFIPAILYFELWVPLWWVCIYIVLHSIFALFWMGAFSAKYVSRHGSKLSMIIWVLWGIVHLTLLMFASKYPFLVYFSPVFSWLHTAFFWIAHHSIMSQWALKSWNIWRLNAFIESAVMVASIIGPYIWWVIVQNYWENIWFLAALFFIILSIIPLLLSRKKHTPQTFSLHKEMNFIRNNFNEFIVLGKTFFWIGYIKLISWILWPIVLFGFFQNYETVWLVSMVASIVVVIVISIVWKLADKWSSKVKKIIQFNAYLQWLNRLFAGIAVALWFFSNILFLWIDTFQKITRKMNDSYMNQLFYKFNDSIKSRDSDVSGLDGRQADHIEAAWVQGDKEDKPENAWSQDELANINNPEDQNPIYWVILHEFFIHWTTIVFWMLSALLFLIVWDNFSYISVLFFLVLWVVPLQLALIFSSKTITM